MEFYLAVEMYQGNEVVRSVGDVPKHQERRYRAVLFAAPASKGTTF